MRLIPRGARSSWQAPRMALLGMVFSALAGGLATGFSLAFHTHLPATVHSTIVSNQPPPTRIVVAVRGTPAAPGFVGLVVELIPARQAIRVSPISPTLPVSVGSHQVPLWLAASQARPAALTAVIRRATGLRFHYYFYVPDQAMFSLLDILYAAAPQWPATLTPTAMETILGYPAESPHVQAEIRLMEAMEAKLPEVPEKIAAPLLTAIKGSQTNLSPYQVFELANYFRGGHLYPGPLLKHAPAKHGRHGD